MLMSSNSCTATATRKKTKIATHNKTTSSSDKKQRYCIVLWDDNTTPMYFVVDLLIVVFGLTLQKANSLMLITHCSGSARFGSYSKKKAEELVNQATIIARMNGYPFKMTIEPISH